MNFFTRYFNTYISNNIFIKKLWIYEKVIFISICYLLISLFIPNNKILFIAATIYFFAIAYIEKSAYKAIIYSFVILRKTSVGQTYIFPIIPSSIHYNPGYDDGRSLLFIVTPIIIVYCVSIIYALFLFIKKQHHRIPVFVLFSFLYVLCSMISSFQSTYYPDLSMMYSLTTFGYVSWLLCLIMVDRKQHSAITRTLIGLLAITIIFEGGIVIAQLVHQNKLGLLIENATMPENIASDDLNFLIRPIGLHSHSNILANSYINILVVCLFFLTTNFKKITNTIPKNWLLVSSGISLFIIIVTRSRNAYLALSVYLFIIMVYSDIPHVLYRIMTKYKRYILRWRLLLMAICMAGIFLILYRLLYSINTFQEFGDYYLRSGLTEQTYILMEKFFPWGTGTGMFIPAAHEFFSTNQRFFFPESVHNGFLLILAENGIFTFIFFLASYIFFFRYLATSRLSHREKVAAFAGSISSGIMMIFHPIINLLPFIMVFTYIYEKQIVPRKQS